MTQFACYRDSFPNARLTRSESDVLGGSETDGGTLVFNGHIREEFVELFQPIACDRDSRVVILTRWTKSFMESISPEGFDLESYAPFSERGTCRPARSGRYFR